MNLLSVQKYAGLLLVTAGIALWVFNALTNTRGLPYRTWSRYVMDMENQLKSMFIWSNATYIATVQAAVALTFLSGWVFLGSPLMMVIAGLAVAMPPTVISSMVKSRRDKIDNQMNGWALALANALKSTASIGDALAATVVVTPKPLVQEVELALKQVRLGSSLPEALLAMSRRVQTKSIDIVVSTLLIGRQTGGDLPTILERTAASLRELKRLEEFTAKTVRSAKQTAAMAAVGVIGTVIALPQIMPSIFSMYRTTVKGQLVASQLALAYCVACYMAYKFTRTDI